jgi:hypothetical protein
VAAFGPEAHILERTHKPLWISIGPANNIRKKALATITCKLCQQVGTGVKAHIIPEAFFRAAPGYDEKLPLITNQVAGSPPRRSPNGIYDPELVCEQCEGRFLPWDTYAAELLLNRLPVEQEGHLEGREVFVEVDYHRLKLFFISLLWRASATSQRFFALSKVGPYEELARQSILTNSPGPEDDLACNVNRWVSVTGRNSEVGPVFSPVPIRHQGVMVMQFTLGPIAAFVKVDRQPHTRVLRSVQLSPNRPLHVLCMPWESNPMAGMKQLNVDRNKAKGYWPKKWPGRK